jgi:hypothetical protein
MSYLRCQTVSQSQGLRLLSLTVKMPLLLLWLLLARLHAQLHRRANHHLHLHQTAVPSCLGHVLGIAAPVC